MENGLQQIVENITEPRTGKTLSQLNWLSRKPSENTVEIVLPTPLYPIEDLEIIIRTELKKNDLNNVKINFLAQVSPQVPVGKKPIPGVPVVIGFASGKGGVGKSSMAINTALAMVELGARVGYLDADVYGPSLPAQIGFFERAELNADRQIMPHERFGMKLMSSGFLVERTQPMTLRGPMTHKLVQQFLYQTHWGDLDYLIVDLPPGTGDILLTMTQSAPLSAVVLVTTPQKMAAIDARKGFEMFRSIGTPCLGIIENMSGFVCNHCDKHHNVFSSGAGTTLSQELEIPLLAQIPLHQDMAPKMASGTPTFLSASENVKKHFIGLAQEIAMRSFEYQGRFAKGHSEGWAQPSQGSMEV